MTREAPRPPPEARLAVVAELAGAVAHELGNSLAAHLLTLALLRDSVREPDARRLLASLEGELQRGAGIARLLQSLIRGADDRRPLTDLSRRLRELAVQVEGLFPEPVEVRWDVDDELPAALAHPIDLSRALVGLCLEARDRMPDGGRLTFRARAASEPPVTRIEIRCAPVPVSRPGTSAKPDFEEMARQILEDQGGGLEVEEGQNGAKTWRVELPAP